MRRHALKRWGVAFGAWNCLARSVGFNADAGGRRGRIEPVSRRSDYREAADVFEQRLLVARVADEDPLPITLAKDDVFAQRLWRLLRVVDVEVAWVCECRAVRCRRFGRLMRPRLASA